MTKYEEMVKALQNDYWYVSSPGLKKKAVLKDDDTVVVEWAGANKDNTQVTYHKDTLTIEVNEDAYSWSFVDRDPTEANISFKDGIITIYLPERKEVKGVIIPVKTEES